MDNIKKYASIVRWLFLGTVVVLIMSNLIASLNFMEFSVNLVDENADAREYIRDEQVIISRNGHTEVHKISKHFRPKSQDYKEDQAQDQEEEQDEMKNTNKVFIVVPYRDREANLQFFADYMSRYLQDVPNVKILVIEQGNRLLFNRGTLGNIGISQSIKMGASDDDCIIMHDVDLLPFPGIDYTKCEKIYMLSHSIQLNGWKPLYDNYFGGVTSMPLRFWKQANGFDNRFWGWGAEDDDLYRRCKLAGLFEGPIAQNHLQAETRYFNIHTNNDKREKKEKSSISFWKKTAKKDTSDAYKTVGLNTVDYQVVSETPLVVDWIVKIKANFTRRNPKL